MKPTLDKMTDIVVKSLSGEAREFYDREFNFFNEVTSISGKLKPYIKKTKLEKKVSISVETGAIVILILHRQKLMKKWPKSKWTPEYTCLVTQMVWLWISTKSQGGHFRVTRR